MEREECQMLPYHERFQQIQEHITRVKQLEAKVKGMYSQRET